MVSDPELKCLLTFEFSIAQQHDIPCSNNLQDILERFEFFPIKCRIQRALEIFQMTKDRKTQTDTGAETPPKTKVVFKLIHINCGHCVLL
jgi:hypothetical protein